MKDEEYDKKMAQLLKTTTANTLTEDDRKEQAKIRKALHAQLLEMKNEMVDKHWECRRLNQHNSTQAEIEAAIEKVRDLKGRIRIREDALNKFYDKL